MSVSMSKSATGPCVARGGYGVGGRSERGREGGVWIGSVVEVLVDSLSDHLRHREAFDRGDAIDLVPLLVGEIHLRSR